MIRAGGGLSTTGDRSLSLTGLTLEMWNVGWILKALNGRGLHHIWTHEPWGQLFGLHLQLEVPCGKPDSLSWEVSRSVGSVNVPGYYMSLQQRFAWTQCIIISISWGSNRGCWYPRDAIKDDTLVAADTWSRKMGALRHGVLSRNTLQHALNGLIGPLCLAIGLRVISRGHTHQSAEGSTEGTQVNCVQWFETMSWGKPWR